MNYSKCFVLITIGIALSIVGSQATPYGDSYNRNENSRNHDLFIGTPRNSDTPTVREHVKEDYELLRKLTVNRTFYAPVGHVITAIHALDQNNVGDGAEATVLDGGIGQNSVNMRFVSQRSHGIDFVVKLFTFTPNSE